MKLIKEQYINGLSIKRDDYTLYYKYVCSSAGARVIARTSVVIESKSDSYTVYVCVCVCVCVFIVLCSTPENRGQWD